VLAGLQARFALIAAELVDRRERRDVPQAEVARAPESIDHYRVVAFIYRVRRSAVSVAAVAA
jgi:hypothetical protein